MFLSDIADFAKSSSKKKKPYNPYHPAGLAADVVIGGSLGSLAHLPVAKHLSMEGYRNASRGVSDVHLPTKSRAAGAALVSAGILGTHVLRRKLQSNHHNRR